MNFSVAVYSSTLKHCHRSWAVGSLSSIARNDSVKLAMCCQTLFQSAFLSRVTATFLLMYFVVTQTKYNLSHTSKGLIVCDE